MPKFCFVAVAGFSMCLVVSPAYGQASPAGEPVDPPQNVDDGTALNSGEEIIVQARRRDESQQDVPLVVNAVTAEALQKLNIRQFEEIQNVVPGLQLATSANGIGVQASIRGISYDVNASGNAGTIEFYLNDAPLSAGILFQSLFDVGQIEVLRGPQGTLRGRASPSGSIIVTTRRPNLTQAGGYVTGTVTDLGGWNVNGGVGIPIIADRLAVRVAGVYDENEGNRVRSINSAVQPLVRTKGGRISVRAEPTDWLSLFGSYTRTRRDSRQFDQVESASLADPTAAPSPQLVRASERLAVSFTPRDFIQDFEVFNWSAQARFAGQRLDYVGSVNHQRYRTVQPSDPGAFFGAAYPAALQTLNQTTNTRANQETHELRLSNQDRVAGIFDYVIGGLYNRLDSPSQITQLTPLFLGVTGAGTAYFPAPVLSAPAALGGPFATTPITRSNRAVEKSLFANLIAHLGEGTEISGGARYIHYTSTGSLAISGTPVAAANENSTRNAWIFAASLKHEFRPDLMAYFSFGSSWRPGSATNPIIFRENVAPSPRIAGLQFPGDERSRSYEVGVKSEWFDRRLRVNLAAFYQDFDNYAYSAQNIYFAGTSATGAQTVFLASPGIAVGVPADVKGIEAEIAFRPSDRWDMTATLSYAKSRIRNGTVPCNVYGGAIPTFAQVAAATGGEQIALCNVNYSAGTLPPFSASIQTEYLQPIRNNVDGYVRGLLNVSGNSQNDPANPFDDVPGYALLNLYAGVRERNGGWELGAYVKNVFGVERVLNRNAQAYGVGYTAICSPQIPGIGAACPSGLTVTGGTGVSSYRGVTFTQPREFGLTARVSFGSK